MMAYFFIQKYFKCDYDLYKVLSVIYDHYSTDYCWVWQRTNNFVT